jgi:hypothetical protein
MKSYEVYKPPATSYPYAFPSLSQSLFNPLNAELNPICHLLALLGGATIVVVSRLRVNPLNAELNRICHLLALLGGATIVVVSRLRVNLHGRQSIVLLLSLIKCFTYGFCAHTYRF